MDFSKSPNQPVVPHDVLCEHFYRIQKPVQPIFSIAELLHVRQKTAALHREMKMRWSRIAPRRQAGFRRKFIKAIV